MNNGTMEFISVCFCSVEEEKVGKENSEWKGKKILYL
jgi:hypothetical protein